jgi:hypothetical protein
MPPAIPILFHVLIYYISGSTVFSGIYSPEGGGGSKNTNDTVGEQSPVLIIIPLPRQLGNFARASFLQKDGIMFLN